MGQPSPAPSPGLCPSQTGKASALLGGTGLGSNETINHIIMTLTSPARQAKGSVRTGRALLYSGCVLGPLRSAQVELGEDSMTGRKEGGKGGRFIQPQPSPKLSLAVL